MANNCHPQDMSVQNWLADASTPAGDIQKYLHIIAYKPLHGFQDRPFALARVALDLRIADQAQQAADKLSQLVATLINVAKEQKESASRLERQTETLIGVGQEQKNLAKKLERQTNKLIWLTWVLAGLTAGLLLLAFRESKFWH